MALALAISIFILVSVSISPYISLRIVVYIYAYYETYNYDHRICSVAILAQALRLFGHRSNSIGLLPRLAAMAGVLDFGDLEDIGEALVDPPSDIEDAEPPTDVEDENEEDKFCAACDRSMAQGVSIANLDETLPWGLKGGRGSHCEECLNAWRLSLRDAEVPLSTLPVHLRDPGNKAEFQLALLAWSSIRREGKRRVSGHDLLKRVSSFKWMLKQMGLPIGPWLVKTLEQGAPLPSNPFALATLRDGEAHRLVEIVAAEPSQDRSLPRPTGSLPLYLGAATLITDIRDEKELVRNACTTHASEHRAAICDAATSENKASPTTTKFSRYLQTIETKSLAEFGNATWKDTCLESTFGTILSKLQPMRQECALLDDDDAQLVEIDEVMTGIGHGKHFLRNFRNMRKVVKVTLDKELMLEPHCAMFIAYLESRTSVTPCPTLLFLRARGCFLRAFRDTLNINEALEALAAGGWATLLLGDELWARLTQQQSATSIDKWLRELVYLCVAHRFDKWGDAEVQITEYTALSDQLFAFSTGCRQQGFDVPGLAEDLPHVGALLRAPSANVSAKPIRAAKEHLACTPRCTLLQSLFKDSVVGMRVSAAADTILETSSSDTVGDKRIEMAIAALRGNSVVRIVETQAGVHVVEREELALDGTVYTVLLDVVGHILECKKIWSQSRACSAAEVEGVQIRDLFADVTFASYIASLGALHSRYNFVFPGVESLPAAEDFNKSHFEELQPIFKKIAWTQNQHPFKLETQKRFAATYEKYVEAANNDSEDWLKSVFDQELLEELQTRNSVLAACNEVVQALSKFAGPYVFFNSDGTLDPQLYNNIAADTGSQEPVNFLACSVNLLVKCKELARVCAQGTHIVEAPFALVISEKTMVTPMALSDLYRCPEFLRDNKFAVVAQSYVMTSAAQILIEFRESCELEAMRNFTEADAQASMMEKLERVLCTAEMPKTLSAATTWFDAYSEAEPHWWLTVAKLLMLWRKMGDALDALDTKVVDASALIVGGGAARRPVVMDFMEHYKDLNVSMASFGYIMKKLSVPDSVVAKNHLCAGLKKAVAVCDTALNAASLRASTQEFMEYFAVQRLDTFVPRDRLESWCVSAQELMPTIKTELCFKALASQEPLVAQVEKHTPRYSHVVSDTMYSKALAQQCIINWAFTDRLEAEVGDLFTCLVDLSTMVTTWNVKAELEENELWIAARKRATEAANDGKKFLRVRAACNIVQHMKGKDQIDNAKAILTKGSLPEKLTSALNAAIKQNGGANSGPFKRKRSDEDFESSDPVGPGQLASSSTALVP